MKKFLASLFVLLIFVLFMVALFLPLYLATR